jgi:hypothetical protein
MRHVSETTLPAAPADFGWCVAGMVCPAGGGQVGKGA